MPRLQGDYYTATARPVFSAPALQGRLDAEVCVVGGGFAGLNTALGLLEKGVGPVALIEARQVGFGASGRNGGFVFGGFSRGEDALLREVGHEHAAALYGLTTDAVRLIRQRVDHYAIDCEPVDGGVIWANWFADPAPLRARQELLATRYGTRWHWLSREQMRESIGSSRYADGLFEDAAFHFHPLAYARGLAGAIVAQGGSIHECSPAVALARDGSGWRVSTPDGEVRSRQVVLACGGYLAGLSRRIDESVLPIATYVMVTEPLGPRLADFIRTPAAIYDTRFAFDYYRALPDTRILWGGRISVLDRPPAEVEALLRDDMRQVFPELANVAIDYAWSGLMSYAPHQMPHVLPAEPGLWVAQAFGGHGVAPTTAAGELVSSAIAHGDERWKWLSRYGLQPVYGPAGLVAAQMSYWWAQSKDALKELLERGPR